MKKILFYLPFIKVGGIEKVAIEYMQGLVARGHHVELLIDFDMGKEGNSLEQEIPQGVRFKYIKSVAISKLIYFFRTQGKKFKFINFLLYFFVIISDFFYYHLKVKKQIEKENYDVVISFFQFLPSYITKIKPTKHVIWLHGSIEHFFNGITKFFKKNYGKKLDKYDYVITIADEMRDQLIEFYPKFSQSRIKRIYNPFNFGIITEKADDLTGMSQKEKIFLQEGYICTVARIDENQKDILTLINAYKKLIKDRAISHKLYIIGDGPDRGMLESKVKVENLEDQVFFLGKKSNPYVWMKNADLFILSSKYEGLPTVLIEAMTVGTFVISSNCKTGPKEILGDGLYGELFEIGNSDQLADKIFKVINNKDEANKKVQLAKENIKKFSSNKSIVDLEKILGE